jgi:amidase
MPRAVRFDRYGGIDVLRVVEVDRLGSTKLTSSPAASNCRSSRCSAASAWHRPARRAISTGVPGNFGGNMDYAGMNAGVKLMLPVNEPGALLFIGDGHARMGEGEVVGSGLETSMDVEFTVDLVKKKTIGWPRLENDTHIMVLGSARPLLEALQHATSELQRWLMADYGMTERGAQIFMGQGAEYEIANVVDPNFTVVAKIRKSMLPKR